VTASEGKVEEQMWLSVRSKHDEDGEEIMLIEAWPHMQIVYELLLRLIVLKQYEPKVMLHVYTSTHQPGQITHKFVSQLIELFKCPDPRERDYLKTIVHRLYGKCLSLRSLIRQKIVD
jgi:serine/threonine-protein phosphatase 2A regulatory subunit B'